MNTRTTRRSLLVTAAVALIAGSLLLPSQSQAALQIYDGFGVGAGGYTDGADINGEGHGIGWGANTWTTTTGVTDFITEIGSIAPSNIASQDGVLVRSGGNESSADLGREYTTTFGGANPTISEAWFSFGLQRNVHNRSLAINPISSAIQGGAGQFFGVFADNGSADLFAKIRFGASADVAISADSFSLSLGTEYFIVGQVQFNSTGINDVMNVYVFEASSFPGSLPGSPTMTVSHDFDNSFDSWAIFSQNPVNNTDVLVFDEFRIGESFGDVTPIPEPSSVSLVAMAALGLAMFRRRRGL